MNEKTIFLDLDGVILDTEERVVQLKNQRQDLEWDEFFEQLDWQKLLSEAQEINGAIQIIRELQDRNKKIIILTKIHTLLEASAKVMELRYNRGITIPIMFVPPHIKKSEIYQPKNNEILIDDSIKNINDWNEHGGTGILFSETDDNNINTSKVKSLKFLLK